MALKSASLSLTTSFQTIYTCPPGTEASVHGLVITNNTNAADTYTLLYYKANNNTTYTLCDLFPVGSRKSVAWSRPINLQSGDYVRLKCATNGALEATASVYEGTTVAQGFSLVGTWNSGNQYYTNNIVSYGSSSYAAISDNINQNPSTATNYWQVLSTAAGLFNGGVITESLVVADSDITADNIIANTSVKSASYLWANGQPFVDGTYLSANIGAYQTYANTQISDIDANIGSYQTYANTQDSDTSANIGSYQLYANANIGTLYLGNVSTNANIGAYQTFANTQINTINANVGAYQTWANANAATQATSIDLIDANIGAYQTFANTSFNSLATGANANTAAYLTTATGNISAGGLTVLNNFSAVGGNVFLGNVGNLHIAGGAYGQILETDGDGNVFWIDNTPTTTTFTANSIVQTGGVYVSGNIASIQTFGDYNLANGYYSLTDGSGSSPAWYLDIDFLNVENFNRVVLNISYTQASGHTVYVQLYNLDTSTWDNIGTYTGLGSYYAFALDVIDGTAYIDTGASDKVQLRIYHSNSGVISHTTYVDYAALELSNQGPQGPRGPTGATGATGAGVATGGTAGQVLIKNSGTNYDTSWLSDLTSLGNISATGQVTITNTTQSIDETTGALIVAGGAGIGKDLHVLGEGHFESDLRVNANLTINGNIVFTGNAINISSNNLTIEDSIINLHTFANLAPLTLNDGKDIGIGFHYYDYEDSEAFLGRANNTGYLEWYAKGAEGPGNTFVGTAYGTIKSGALLLANTAGTVLSVAGNTAITSTLYAQGVYDNGIRVVSTSTGAGNLSISAGAIALPTTGPGAINVGSATSIPTIVTDAYGRMVSLTANAVSTTVNLAGNSGTGSVSGGGTLTLTGTNGFTATVSGSTITLTDTLWTQANANLGTATTNISTINANIGAYQLYANANIGTLHLGNISTNANLGAYQIYANANLGTATTNISTINANIGAFHNYANTKIGTNTNSNLVVVATTTSESTTTGALVVGGGAGLAGNLNVGGNTRVTGNTLVYSSVSSAERGVTAVSGNADGSVIAPNNSGVLLHISGQVNNPGRVYIDGQGTGAYSAIVGRRYNGTTATPTGLAFGDTVFRLGSTPYHSTGWPSISTTRIDYIADELQTSTALGSRMEFTYTPQGTAATTLGLRLASNGFFIFGNTIVSNTTAATSTTTGALVVGGGAGIGGATYIGGVTNSAGNIVAASGTASTTTTTGALVVVGGAGVSGAIYAGSIQNTPVGSTTASTGAFTTLTSSGTTIASGNIVAASGTASTTTTTGALVVVGGIGASGAVNIGGNLAVNTATDAAITTTTATAEVFNTTATTVKLGGAATALSMGAATGTTTVNNSLTTSGNLAVNNATAAGLNSTTAVVELFPSAVTTLRIGGTSTVSSLSSNTASTSSTTGALVVTGGTGIGGTIYVRGTGGNAIVASGTIWDDVGELRDIPPNSQTANPYTAVAADAGRHILYGTNTGNVTLPGGSVFTAGQAITVVNNTATNITISQSVGSTIRLSGTATTGNRTLAQYGIATALCIVGGATPTFVVSGAGLT